MKQRLRCDQTAGWSTLSTLAHHTKQHGFDLRSAFSENENRINELSQPAPNMFADLSKNWVNMEIEKALWQLADECDLQAYQQAMLKGSAINTSENRMVGHMWLRLPNVKAIDSFIGKPESDAAHEAMKSVFPAREALLDFAEKIRADDQISDIVNIGIGGSDLGPRMAYQALLRQAHPNKKIHFVSNIDGDELLNVLGQIKPTSTLFIIASKSFTTLEPLLNAMAAREWFLEQGGNDVARHFCALSSNFAATKEFGIETVFEFGDWVGGRYSIWSAIGLSLAISIGRTNFLDFLQGAHEMDVHFIQEKWAENLAVRMGLLDVWYRLLGSQSRCITPYHSNLARFPSYLQQLEMESNGKSVDTQGNALCVQTAPVLWGDVGTNAQHAYFQLLHQGSDVPLPVEIIAIKDGHHTPKPHHQALLANAIGQAQALMQGSDQAGYRYFSGNRPSCFLMLNNLTPKTLGSLIALYEHRVFVSGAIWGINSFDQWGVQLGKVLSNDLVDRMNTKNFNGLDASTRQLLSL